MSAESTAPAVRWSEYEGHYSALRSEIIADLCTKLSDLMDSASRQGRSSEFMSGIEASILLAQRMVRPS